MLLLLHAIIYCLHTLIEIHLYGSVYSELIIGSYKTAIISYKNSSAFHKKNNIL